MSLFRKIKTKIILKMQPKTNFHFVKDYQKLVRSLMNEHPLDEAMSLAVGGSYNIVGSIEKDILLYSGLKQGMSVIDLGCGSGRLASKLDISYNLNYTGIDVVDELLLYAAKKSPNNYKFIKNLKLEIPGENESADMMCAFSLFTHLLHEESYIYLEDMHRVLKKDGILVFSFLEFDCESHWSVFMGTVNSKKKSVLPHLNTFIEKSVIKKWAEMLGYNVEEIIDGKDKKFNGKAFGQSVCILKKKL
jgi:ubiquinone/menaquinone biosynthesis C-methylase UbiE